MSKDTGANKGQLSSSSTEIEEGATEKTTNEGSQELKTTNQQLTDENQKNDGEETLGAVTQANEDTAVSPANIRNNVIPGDGTRQIIAVSANKNPTAFFQLARKFLMTNEMCDLSALEGAIVSAVDAAHLLERSKLASIVRIHTSYVSVEPKRRRQVLQQKGEGISAENVKSTSKSEETSSTSNITTVTKTEDPSPSVSASVADSKKSTNASESQQGGPKPSTASTTKSSSSSASGSGNRELRRARILVTVKRTESYKRWLEENPTQRQAIIAGTATVATEDVVGGGSSSNKEDSNTLLATIDHQAAIASSSKDS